MVKIIIVGLVLAIVYNLGRGLFFLVKTDSDRDKVAKALTWRVGLSAALVAFLLLSYAMGWLQFHAVP